MSFAPPFVQELCQYLADNTGGHFTFGVGDTNLKVGEVLPGTKGVYAVTVASPPPDPINPMQYYEIDFWSVNPSSNLGYVDLQYVYDLFHGAIAFSIGSYLVFSAEATSQIEDMDRDSEGRKLWRLGIYCTARNLIS